MKLFQFFRQVIVGFLLISKQPNKLHWNKSLLDSKSSYLVDVDRKSVIKLILDV